LGRPERRFLGAALLLAASLALAQGPAGPAYYPDAAWRHRTAAESGFDPQRLKEAIDFAVASEAKNPRDLTLNHYQTFGREPFGALVGPVKDRGEPTGVIVHQGYIVAEWGEPARVDMTHSVTKSVLSSVIGIAFERGLIRSLDDPVHGYVGPIVVAGSANPIFPFETPHNRKITWNHMLRQTSDWEGTLWGKPDWADRPSPNRDEWTTRARAEPGTTWKYNDVRVNALALAALNVWRRPLPQVAKEYVMDPIGASDKWRWYGYENSWIVLDGATVQSVSGGGHWGGGLFIDAWDMARFGYLTLRHGRWKDRQVIADRWVDLALTPTPVRPEYGFMNWYNNRDGKLLPSAPRSAFAHIGNGTNMIYVDPEHDLVIVLRWIESAKIDEFVKRLLAALKP
jgi:CubicO group peptidase (beta-lactamase class C family)